MLVLASITDPLVEFATNVVGDLGLVGIFVLRGATWARTIAVILVVAAAVIGSVTVLPALLAILGRWVDRPRVPLLWRLQSRDGNPRFWRAVLRPVLARPAVAFAVGTGLLLALAAPAVGMRLGDSGIDDLPKDSATLQAYDRVLATRLGLRSEHPLAGHAQRTGKRAYRVVDVVPKSAMATARAR